jgi:hypothetical protein
VTQCHKLFPETRYILVLNLEIYSRNGASNFPRAVDEGGTHEFFLKPRQIRICAKPLGSGFQAAKLGNEN